MIGHGRPNGRHLVVLLIALVSMFCMPVWAGESVRVRISWGGGKEQLWRGVAWLDQGTLSNPLLLGIEADEPSSMWIGNDRLIVRQRSPRTYDGVDLDVDAPASATLHVELTTANRADQPMRISVPLADIRSKPRNTNLDDRGNRLMIRRSPGDFLRVQSERESLVFSTGEFFRFDLLPHELPVADGTKLRIKIELHPGRKSNLLWSAERTVQAGESTGLPLEIPLPEKEGVYDVTITAVESGRLRLPGNVVSPPLNDPLNWKQQSVAARKIQVMVLDTPRPKVPIGAPGEWRHVVEIDPANPKWWERFAKLPQIKLGRTPQFWKGPLNNDHSDSFEHTLGRLVRLAPSSQADDWSWEAFSLPIEKPGQPHRLEVDYPSDIPQTLGISLIEPNESGAVYPVGVDSGMHLSAEIVERTDRPGWRTHRVIFWPRTQSPMVLITNQQDERPAVFGKIRVTTAGPHLPRCFPLQGPRPQRLLAAYMDRPMFPENFSASETVGSMNDLGVDDWITFHQGGSRLIEYLNYMGMGGIMMAVLADGSTIYPSSLVEPTPRYDTGIFHESGQDPVRKDVLEMLFRMFDREGLELIPSIEFASPLPELEAVLRRGGPQAEGIRWIGANGRSWRQVYPSFRGMAPYYNVLHPQVQQAMLSVVRELVGKYGRHTAFSGLSIQLSAYGYAQLPGPSWGMDDVTIARFEKEMNVRVPGTGANRYSDRARFLSTQCPRQWIEWRAVQLARFHRKIEAELTAVRSDAPLYLSGANMYSGKEIRRTLQPSLPRRTTLSETLLRVGIDSRWYGDEGPMLLCPERITAGLPLSHLAIPLELRQMPDAVSFFEGRSTTGSLLFHQPREARVPSFDRKSPFQPTYTWLVTHAVPSAARNRQRFIHALATLDSQVIFDGGWQLPLGQEESIRHWMATYRQLPAIRFARLEDPSEGTTQPVTIRHATYADSTYIYLVNDAPFVSTVRIHVAMPTGCRVEELSGLRPSPVLNRDSIGPYFSVELQPYDLLGLHFSSPRVTFSKPRVSWSNEIRQALQSQITGIEGRAAALRNPPVLDVLENAGFEQIADEKDRIPGWAASKNPNATVVLDPNQPHTGSHSVRISSQGPVATLISEPFEMTATGRLTMSVWLRSSDPSHQPALRLTLVGRHQGRELHRVPWVGPGVTGQTIPKIGNDWEPLVAEVNDLPLERLSGLQIRFDLTGPGEVWIDDVQLCNLAFSSEERVELFKLLAPADWKLQRGEVVDCMALLDSYWPRFLMANVPIDRIPIDQPTVRVTPKPSRRPPRSTSLLDRMKKLLPRNLRY